MEMTTVKSITAINHSQKICGERFNPPLQRLRCLVIYLFSVVCVLVASLFCTAPVLSDEVLELADRLMEQGHYDDAITEYKRFVFFNPESEEASHALYRMGLAYRADRKWQNAIDSLKASISATGDPDIADERRIILATTLIASGNYSLARLALLEISEFSSTPSLRHRARYFDGIASLYMFDWNAVDKAFDGFYSEYNEGMEQAGEIDSILLEARKAHKSPRLAKFLSTILPGLGQVYAGDWRDGLNAFVLNGLSIGLLANSIYRKDYVDAILISSISMRYYTGNRYRAEIDVRKYNRYMDQRNAVKILNLVSSDEP